MLNLHMKGGLCNGYIAMVGEVLKLKTYLFTCKFYVQIRLFVQKNVFLTS